MKIIRIELSNNAAVTLILIASFVFVMLVGYLDKPRKGPPPCQSSTSSR